MRRETCEPIAPDLCALNGRPQISYDVNMMRQPAWGPAGRGLAVLAGRDDTFGAPVLERWPVPPSLRIERHTLAYPPPPWKKRAPRPDRHIVEGFLLLAEGDDLPGCVRAYAERWGPLGICRHDGLAGHPVLDDAGRGLCAPRGYPGPLSEPLERWRYWARYMRSLLNLAAALESGEAGDPEDWEHLAPVPRPFSGGLSQGDIALARQALAAAATSLLETAQLRLRMVPEDGRYAMRLGPPVLFSALFCALTLEVVRRTLGRELAVCSKCGRLFSARHAPTGRHRWCPREACQRAARAQASRRYRERKSKAEG